MANRPTSDDPEPRETAERAPDVKGRALEIEPSPEGRLMQIDTISTPDEDVLSQHDSPQAASDETEDRAARDARMEVRRREHSAD